MKFFAATAALALAAVSTVSAEECVIANLAASLGPVITPAGACQTATGYTIIPPVAMPTAAQVTSICSQCTELITAAKDIKFPSCTLKLGGVDTPVDQLFNSIVGKCGAAGAGSAANATTTTPNATEPATTTAAPEATTVAPTETPAAGSMDDAASAASADGDDVVAPSTNGSTPAAATPAPSSAGVSATIGAAVAVACSIAAFVL